MTTENKLDDAEAFAKQRHVYQIRKDGKTPYSAHLQDVVNNLKELGIKDEDILCAGWLHDTIEDTPTDFDDIEEDFGLEVAQIVAAVTKDKRLPEEKRETDYVAQLEAASWKAHVVKLCDIWTNIDDIPSGYHGHQKQVEHVEKKLRYFEAIRKGLYENGDKIPNLDKGLDELNALLSSYGKTIKL